MCKSACGISPLWSIKDKGGHNVHEKIHANKLQFHSSWDFGSYPDMFIENDRQVNQKSWCIGEIRLSHLLFFYGLHSLLKKFVGPLLA
jgi:hypothetical protein